MSNDPIYADAFGGKFPVCSEKDKVAIEEGFKKAKAWLDSEEGRKMDEEIQKECYCAIIARLLNGTATYGDMIVLGIQTAGTIYRRKMMGEMVLDLMESLRDAGMQTVPVPGDKPKKEWIN